jgi:hypothetical protein
MRIAEPVGTHSPSFRAGGPNSTHSKAPLMNRFIWLVGAVVIVIAVLSFFGLR